MCGIVGAIAKDGRPLNAGRLKPMCDLIAHRGPDDAGYMLGQSARNGGFAAGRAFSDSAFKHLQPTLPCVDDGSAKSEVFDKSYDVMFGHRRLSIIDLSASAHQPMVDRQGGTWITYNGEVYNFRELRIELESLGHRFVSNSDTEVVLVAYKQWGMACVERFNGMFAFALWDTSSGKVLLARDRYGIKPLYYADTDDTLLFASEIKPLLAYDEATAEMDVLALNEYLSFQNVFSDRTLFAGVRLLEPGHVLTFDVSTRILSKHQFWNFDFTGDLTDNKEDVRANLTDLMRQAVKRQCVSDVEIGSYLSGGMDSGTIASLTTEELGRINTFTAGFDLSEAAGHELNFDERKLAESIANILGSEHYEYIVHSSDMEAVMDWLVAQLEDLRVGQSYPNALVAKLASRFVKVVMSGVGGDELFGGYPWRYASAVGRDTDDYIMNYYTYWQRLVTDEDKSRLYTGQAKDALHNALGYGANKIQDHTRDVFKSVFPKDVSVHGLAAQINQSLYFECKTFLHGLLVVEDRLSMAHGLETRVPFLDNDLVDYACRIPADYKINDMQHMEVIDENLPRKKKHITATNGKMILRSAMENILPPQVTDRQKQGFSAPDASWFRGQSEAFLRDKLMNANGPLYSHIDFDYVKSMVDEHVSGDVNHRLLIWSFLNLDAWLNKFSKPIN